MRRSCATPAGRFDGMHQTREFVAAHIRHQDMHGYSMRAVVQQATAQVIGEAGFLRYDEGVEVGWRLRRSAWGRGYGTEVGRACLTYGFRELEFDQVSAFVEVANRKALHVIEKLEMRLVKRSAEGAAPWAEYVAMPEFSR